MVSGSRLIDSNPGVEATKRWRRKRLLIQAILGVLAVIAAMIYTTLGVTYPITGGGETIAIADSLVKDGSFANPFAAGKTGTSAFLPPLYPMFRAGMVKVFGSHALLLSMLITLLMHGLHAGLLPSISVLLLGRWAPGVWAAILAIVLPLFDVLHWEAMYVAAGLLAFILYSAWVFAPSVRGGLLRGAGLGAAAALLILTNPVSILAFAPWLAVLIWPRRSQSQTWRIAMGALLALCLGLAPWTIRNYRHFGRFIFVRDNFGVVLYVSNNDCAAPALLENLRNGCNDRFAPIANRDEVNLIRQIGEAEYGRNRLRIAWAWIQREPRRFSILTAQRFVEFWFPREAYSFWVITGLAILGTFVLIRNRVRSVWTMLAICALYPVVYYVAEGTPRYRYPIMWISLLQAGYLLDRVVGIIGLSKWLPNENNVSAGASA